MRATTSNPSLSLPHMLHTTTSTAPSVSPPPQLAASKYLLTDSDDSEATVLHETDYETELDDDEEYDHGVKDEYADDTETDDQEQEDSCGVIPADVSRGKRAATADGEEAADGMWGWEASGSSDKEAVDRMKLNMVMSYAEGAGGFAEALPTAAAAGVTGGGESPLVVGEGGGGGVAGAVQESKDRAAAGGSVGTKLRRNERRIRRVERKMHVCSVELEYLKNKRKRIMRRL